MRITRETASLLKDADFHLNVRGFYYPNGHFRDEFTASEEYHLHDCTPAPEQSEVQSFLRILKNVDVMVVKCNNRYRYVIIKDKWTEYDWRVFFENFFENGNILQSFEKYEPALEMGLREALKNLK